MRWKTHAPRLLLGAVVICAAALLPQTPVDAADRKEPPKKSEEHKAPAEPKAPAAEPKAPSEQKKSAKDRADKDVRKQASNRHMQVVARSLKLERKARERLLAIAERYHSATGKKLIITGGDRDAGVQARLMYKKLEHGEDLIKLYARDELVKPIIEAYESGKSADKHSEKRVVRAMTKVIEAQMENEQFVSRHLQFSAADVRSRDLSDDQIAALQAAVRAEPGAQIVDEREGTAPHLHLNL